MFLLFHLLPAFTHLRQQNKARNRDKDKEHMTSGGQLNTILSPSSQWPHNLGWTQFPLKFFWSPASMPKHFLVKCIHAESGHTKTADPRLQVQSALDEKKERGGGGDKEQDFIHTIFFTIFAKVFAFRDVLSWSVEINKTGLCDLILWQYECKKMWRNTIHC